jgi:hypothetical protein
MTMRRSAKVPTALDVFWARCEARAHLYAVGELDLHDAVDVLQEHAVRHGLVDEIGQDAVQAIIVETFRRVCARKLAAMIRGHVCGTLPASG